METRLRLAAGGRGRARFQLHPPGGRPHAGAGREPTDALRLRGRQRPGRRNAGGTPQPKLHLASDRRLRRGGRCPERPRPCGRPSVQRAGGESLRQAKINRPHHVLHLGNAAHDGADPGACRP